MTTLAVSFFLAARRREEMMGAFTQEPRKYFNEDTLEASK